jgi:hypothetical protein
MLLISHVFSEMSRLTDNLENATNDASYRRQVYEAGYSPICPVLFMPTFLKDDAPAEVKDRQEMSDVDLSRKVQSGNTQSLELDEI